MSNYVKSRGLAIFCLILSLLFVPGCGKDEIADASYVDLAKDGTMKVTMTAAFDKDYYDVDEMAEGIGMAVDEYNEKTDGRRIEIKEVRRDEERAEIQMYYRTTADYASFNNVTFLADTVKDGVEHESFPADTVLLPVSEEDAETTAGELAGEKKPGTFVVFMEPISLKVPGKIRYLSEGLSLDEDGRVVTDPSMLVGSSTLNRLCYVVYD